MVSVIIKKNVFLLLNGSSGIPGGSREGSKSGGGAPAGSQGALGKVDQVHWGPFLKVLDLQKVARACILMRILDVF